MLLAEKQRNNQTIHRIKPGPTQPNHVLFQFSKTFFSVPRPLPVFQSDATFRCCCRCVVVDAHVAAGVVIVVFAGVLYELSVLGN